MFEWHYSPFSIPLLLASASAAVLVIFSWRRRHVPGGLPFVTANLGVCIWTLAYALEVSSIPIEGRIAWAKIAYFGTTSVPVSIFAFALEHTGRVRRLPRALGMALALVPILTMILLFTNEGHGLIWSKITPTETDFTTEHGLWFWVLLSYVYTLLLISTYWLIRHAWHTSPLYRWQALLIVGGMLAPWASNLIYLTGLSPFGAIDLTPFGFTLTSLLMGLGLFRFQLFEVVPVARDSVIENMPDGMLILDKQNRVVDLNPAARRLIGLSEQQDVVGIIAADVLKEWPTLVSQYRDVQDAQTELKLETPAGTRDIELRISPVYTVRGSLTGRLILIRDITARKQADLALQQANEEIRRFNEQLEKLVQDRTEELERAYDILARIDKTKSDFIGLAAHELRTPLTVMKGYTQMLKARPGIGYDPDNLQLLTGIIGGVERLQQVVNSILDMTKIEAQALRMATERIVLAAVLDRVLDACEALMATRKLTLKVVPLTDLPAIQADPDLLQKVFYHLLTNAIKYTPDDGQITISGMRVPEETAIEIIIQDTGIGVDPKNHALIFEKFYQAGDLSLHSSSTSGFKGGGPGLGLPIAKGIVLAHRGRIWVDSPAHDEQALPGSQFHVRLPINQ